MSNAEKRKILRGVLINLEDIEDLDVELHKILERMKRYERIGDSKGEARMRRFALNLLGRIEWIAQKGKKK